MVGAGYRHADHVLCLHGPNHCLHRHSHHHWGFARVFPVCLGIQCLHVDFGGDRSDLRQVIRCVRAEAFLHLWTGDVRGWVGDLRPGRHNDGTRTGTRAAGDRGRCDDEYERATVGDIFNPKERGRWMGAMGAVFGLSSIIGPAIGGWITDTFSWRWVFYINLPLAVLAIIGVVLSLPKVRANEQVKIDWFGSALLITGLVPILLGFTWVGTKYAWTSPMLLTLFGWGAIMLALFIWFERKVSDPIITPILFRNRIFSISLILGIFVSMAMFGSVMFLPLFIQGVIGLRPRDSGLVMSPMMISFIVGSIISGQIMTKTGKYRLLSHISAAATLFSDEHKAARAAKANEDKKVDELYAEIGRLTTQLSWLKKKSGLKSD